MITALDPRPPAALEAALTEMDRRLKAAAAVGRTTFTSTEPASIVVINDAPQGLTDPVVLDAVLRLARMGRKANMSVELRGHVPLSLSALHNQPLRDMVLDTDTAHVFYRHLVPMCEVPIDSLIPGATVLVHNDPTVLASGQADTGTFVGMPGGRAWALVQFPDHDHPSRLLGSDLLVEVRP